MLLGDLIQISVKGLLVFYVVAPKRRFLEAVQVEMSDVNGLAWSHNEGTTLRSAILDQTISTDFCKADIGYGTRDLDMQADECVFTGRNDKRVVIESWLCHHQRRIGKDQVGIVVIAVSDDRQLVERQQTKLSVFKARALPSAIPSDGKENNALGCGTLGVACGRKRDSSRCLS